VKARHPLVGPVTAVDLYRHTMPVCQPPKTASFIVYRLGDTFYVEDCRTGEVFDFGADASAAIQYAIDALPTEGGVVFIKAGKYPIKKAIALRSGLTLEGEGRGRIFGVPPYQHLTTILEQAANTDIIKATAAWDKPLQGIAVRNVTLVPREAYRGDAMHLESVNYSIFEDVFIYPPADEAARKCNGLHLLGVELSTFRNIVVGWCGDTVEDTQQLRLEPMVVDGVEKKWCADLRFEKITTDRGFGQHVYAYKVGFVEFEGCLFHLFDKTEPEFQTVAAHVFFLNEPYRDCWVKDCTFAWGSARSSVVVYQPTARCLVHVEDCFVWYAGIAGIAVTRCDAGGGVTIEGCHVEYSNRPGISLNNAKHLKVVDCLVKNNGQEAADTYDGIWVGAVEDSVVRGCSVFDDQAVKTQRYGIMLEATSARLRVVDNVVVDNIRAGVYDGGVGNVVRRNRGHRTEASGTATIAAGTTSVTVAHGLVAAPGKVVATARDVGVGAVACTARDATNITLTCETAPTADVVADWYAEV